MNSISHNGETYVKAGDLARELGYTSDYVGQLCRAEKIDCQLVGRSWYVVADSLRNYKTSQHRRSTKASSVALRQSMLQTNASNSRAAQGSGMRKIAVSYETDEADLIPTVADRGTVHLMAEPAQSSVAEQVPVKTVEKHYHIETEPSAPIRFKGTIAVSEPEELEQEDTPSPRPRATTEPTARPKAKPLPRRSKATTVPVSIAVAHHAPSRTLWVWLQFSLTIALALVISGSLLALETEMTSSYGEVTHRYNYNLSSVQEYLEYPFK